MLVDSKSNLDTKLFNYIAYNKFNEKYDILNNLLKRENFIDNSVENSMSENIDEMLRIKLLSRENIEGMDNLELTKKAYGIPDSQVREIFGKVKETLLQRNVAPEVAQMEIRNFFNNFINEDATSSRVFDYLHNEKGVSEFNDLKKLNEDELRFALRLANLNEENIERVVKSIVSSLA